MNYRREQVGRRISYIYLCLVSLPHFAADHSGAFRSLWWSHCFWPRPHRVWTDRGMAVSLHNRRLFDAYLWPHRILLDPQGPVQSMVLHRRRESGVGEAI